MSIIKGRQWPTTSQLGSHVLLRDSTESLPMADLPALFLSVSAVDGKTHSNAEEGKRGLRMKVMNTCLITATIMLKNANDKSSCLPLGYAVDSAVCNSGASFMRNSSHTVAYTFLALGSLAT